VLFYVLFVCKCVLPPGDNPIAVNKYIIYHTIRYAIYTVVKVSLNYRMSRGSVYIPCSYLSFCK